MMKGKYRLRDGTGVVVLVVDEQEKKWLMTDVDYIDNHISPPLGELLEGDDDPGRYPFVAKAT